MKGDGGQTVSGKLQGPVTWLKLAEVKKKGTGLVTSGNPGALGSDEVESKGSSNVSGHRAPSSPPPLQLTLLETSEENGGEHSSGAKPPGFNLCSPTEQLLKF